MKTRPTNKQRAGRVNWETVVTMTVFHAGALAALFTFTWTALAVSLAVFWVAGEQVRCVGVPAEGGITHG